MARSLAGNNKCYLFSNFDNNKDKNDNASIDDLGKINIEMGDLAGGKSILINYSTSILKNTSINPADVCTRIYYNDFCWEPIREWSEPKIGNITMKVINTQKKMAVLVDPQYNITCWEEGKCRVFKNTKIRFLNDLITKDEANTSFKDDIIDDSDGSKLVNNSYFVNTIGTHKFSGEIRHPFDIIQMDNDTYIQVIDIGDYHKGLIYSYPYWFIIFLIISIMVPLIIVGATRIFKKCRNKYWIGFLLIVTISFYIYLINNYLSYNMIYQDMIKLESITLCVAFMVLIYYYLCIDQKPNIKILFIQILLMFAFTTLFHYWLPEILLNKLDYTFLLTFGPINLVLIFGKKETLCKLNESNCITRIVGCILAFIAIIAGLIYLISGSIIFSPRFGLLEIIIIIFAELMPLITVTITGLYCETAKSFMNLIMKNLKVENS